jgi:hypothetical protein
MLAIIPNFFQLPQGYAISRSVFAIDVKFNENFDRGDYDFYNFKEKKLLYVKGKKFYDYNVVNPSFSGRFFDGYGVDESEYRRRKLEDMQKYDKEEKKVPTVTEICKELCNRMKNNDSKLTSKQLAFWFGVDRRTITRWLGDKNITLRLPVNRDEGIGTEYNKLSIIKENNSDCNDEGATNDEKTL